MFKIELDAPCFSNLEKKYLNQAVDSGFVSSVGPCIAAFEKKMAQYFGAKGAVAIQSGTAAIYMALYELGIGPGDEVIVPSLTFAATVNPVLYTGATPVIVDVDRDTWNIDPMSIQKALTKKTKAIIPVHVYGNPCDMGSIMRLAKKFGLYVIEDATESLGATFNDKYTGTMGEFGCFSFNGNKLITTGGGGMITSNNLKRIEHIRYLINQAKDKDRPSFHSEMGFNFRMTNIEAALGLAQFEKIENFLKQKRNFHRVYENALGDLPNVSFQGKYEASKESFWFSCLKLQSADIGKVIQTLKEKNIPTRRVFVPLNQMPYLKKYSRNFDNALNIYHSGLCLPCSNLNKEKDIQRVAMTLRKVLDA
jgi:perosamine synthetase